MADGRALTDTEITAMAARSRLMRELERRDEERRRRKRPPPGGGCVPAKPDRSLPLSPSEAAEG